MSMKSTFGRALEQGRRASPLAGTVGLVALAATVACGSKQPPPDTTPTATATATAAPDPEPLPPPEPEPIDTGKECATATTQCGGGVCLAKVENKCDTPVTCELGVMVTCSAEATSGQGRGKGRDTVPAGASKEISAEASCAGGTVQLTVADGMNCR